MTPTKAKAQKRTSVPAQTETPAPLPSVAAPKSLFQEAVNSQAYLKAGLYGPEGSGKTYTAVSVAIGLAKLLKSDKPVAFFDTETGVDFMIPRFKAEGVNLVSHKSYSLKELHQAILWAAESAAVLIVDSLTHVYTDLTAAYVRQKRDGTSFIRLQDWQPIKALWREHFSIPYVNSKVHIIWCSRAKNIFEDVEDVAATEQSGHRSFSAVKTGTAPRTEAETGYEPSLLIEMERVHGGNGGGAYTRRARVIKDRSAIRDEVTGEIVRGIDGMEFDNPRFKDFLPHIQALNLGGEHVGVDVTATSDELIGHPSTDWAERRRRRQSAAERIEQTLTFYFPGQSAREKQAKVGILMSVFPDKSWTDIQERMDPLEVEAGLPKVQTLAEAASEGGWKDGEPWEEFVERALGRDEVKTVPAVARVARQPA